MKTYCSEDQLVEAICDFEKNGGQYSTDTHHYRSNDMVIQCRNGMKAMAQFIAEAKQTYLHRITIVDGLYAESLDKTNFPRDTLIIGENVFDCLQWQESLQGHAKFIVKKNQILTDDCRITVITKKLMSHYPLSGCYYRIVAPFGLRHRLQCMFKYSLWEDCFTENKFIFREPYAQRNIVYHETVLEPLGQAKNQDDFFCSICLETYDRVRQIIPCKHTLCFACYEHALRSCHMCRGVIEKTNSLYDESKTTPPLDIKDIMLSLYYKGGLVFSNYMAEIKDTFEKIYPKYLKNTNQLHFCQWPKVPVRISGKLLVDFIFVKIAQEPLPDKAIIDSLCVNDINLHIVYTCQEQLEKWQTLLSTEEK